MDVQKTKGFVFRSAAKVGTLIMVLGSAFSIFIHYFPSGPTQDSDFFGRWDSHYRYKSKGEDISYSGKVEFIRNGRYNVKGVFEHTGRSNGMPFRYLVEAKGSGNWSTADDFLTFTLTDMRQELTSYSVAEIDVPIAELVKVKGPDFIDLNKQYVPGSSDEYKILSSGRQKMTMLGKDLYGNPFTVVNIRQDSLL